MPEFVTAIDYADNPSDTNTNMIDVRVPIGTRLALQSQPAAAGVSDEEIMRASEPFSELLRADMTGYQRIAFARAILALRPQAVPINRDDLKVLMSAAGYVHATAQEKADFINGFRNAEAHHGITTQGAQGGEAK